MHEPVLEGAAIADVWSPDGDNDEAASRAGAVGAYANNNPLRYIEHNGLFVTATYDRATGLLVVTDMDTGRRDAFEYVQ